MLYWKFVLYSLRDQENVKWELILSLSKGNFEVQILWISGSESRMYALRLWNDFCK